MHACMHASTGDLIRWTSLFVPRSNDRQKLEMMIDVIQPSRKHLIETDRGTNRQTDQSWFDWTQSWGICTLLSESHELQTQFQVRIWIYKLLHLFIWTLYLRTNLLFGSTQAGWLAQEMTIRWSIIVYCNVVESWKKRTTITLFVFRLWRNNRAPFYSSLVFLHWLGPTCWL